MSTLTQLFTSIANSIRAKKGTQALIEAENFPNEIDTIQTGITPTGTINITQNGITDVTTYANANVNVEASGGEKDVFFYDYDGALLYSYSKEDFLALDAMPANPSHAGLVAEGWNWSLNDAKTCVTTLGKLNIGQIYHTVSGLSEFDIEINAITGLDVTLNMTGTKNWGDGTTDTNTSHTYTTAGKYTITCDGTTMSQSYLFGNSSNLLNYTVTDIRLTGITSVAMAIFMNLFNLRTIVMPSTLITYSSNMFQYNYNLKAIVIPNGVTNIPSNCFSSNYNLEVVCFPKSVTELETSAFQNCRSLLTVFLSNIFSRFNNSAFYGCNVLKQITFSHGSSQFPTNIFKECYALESIIMPDNILTVSMSNAFQDCRSLKTIKFPNAGKRFPSNVFNGCVSLESITFSNKIERIDSVAFQNCYALKKLDFSQFTTIPTATSNFINGDSQLLKIIVPDNLYESWIAASGWNVYANYIVKASEA